MRRYNRLTALVYDVCSGERPFYRPGRLAAIDALHLSPGQSVLVLGCGTGLDLPPIAAAIGSSGTIVAVDDRAVMLRTARRRLGRAVRTGAPRLRLVLADLTVARSVLPPSVGPVDAVLAVNTLSLIRRWPDAWRTGLAAARPGARVAVADIGRPDRGRPLLATWSRLIAAIGGSDLRAAPWLAVGSACAAVETRSFQHGHVQLRAGSLP